RRRHTRFKCDWSSDVCSSDLLLHVMNITDVDDKIIRNAARDKKTVQEYTRTYEEAFLEDMGSLNLERPEKMVRATEHIGEMAERSEERRVGKEGETGWQRAE